MERLHRDHVSEDQRHEGWSETTPGGTWNPWRLEVRMINNHNLINLIQPHHVPNWNVLLRGLDQRPVRVAPEGALAVPAEVLPDLNVRGHPRQHRLRGQGHQ